MTKVHAAIRAKPDRVAKKKSVSKSKIVQQKPKMIFECANKKKYLREKKVPTAQKNAQRKALLSKINEKFGYEP